MRSGQFRKVIALGLLLLASVVACTPGQRAGLGRAFGMADDVIRPYVDDLARTAGNDAAEQAVSRIGRHVDDGLTSAIAAGDEISPEVRSGFTGVVCQILAQYVTSNTWPSNEALAGFVAGELGGLLAPGYSASQVGDAALQVANSVMNESEIDQTAATEVVCAAAGYTLSR